MDDLLDLNFSAPAPATKPPSSSSPNPYNTSRSASPSAFDLLASSGSANGNTNSRGKVTSPLNPNANANISGNGSGGFGYLAGGSAGTPRSSTPILSSSLGGLSPALGQGLSRGSTPTPMAAKPTAGSNDAFSNLLSSFPTSTSASPNPNNNQFNLSRPSSASAFQSTNTNSNQSMSLAERQAHLLKEKKEREERERGMFDFDSWGSSLGAGGVGEGKKHSPSPSPTPSPMPMPMYAPSSGPGLGLPKPPPSGSGMGIKQPSPRPLNPSSTPSTSTSTSTSNNHNRKKDSWSGLGLDDLLGSTTSTSAGSNSSSSKPKTASGSIHQSQTRKAPADPWDLDAFAAGPQKSTAVSRSMAEADGGGGGFGGGEDDILGMLGAPAEVKKVVKAGAGPGNQDERDGRVRGGDEEEEGLMGSPHSAPKPRTKPKPPSTATSARSTSPPPHIVGQIVEMGFTPAQARRALGNTESGVDVEAAVGMLVSEAASEGRAGGGGGVRKDDDLDEEERERERRRRRRQGPSRGNVDRDRERERDRGDDTGLRERDWDRDRDRERERNSSTPNNSQPQGLADVQLQADKLLAQASEIGFNMFSKANSLWAQGKERAQKLYEERQAAEALRAGNGGRRDGEREREGDGRPRWMIDAENAEAEARERQRGGEGSRAGTRQNGRERNVSSFKDSDDEEPVREEPVRNVPKRTGQRQRTPSPERDRGGRTGDLYGESAPVYKSSARRRPLDASRANGRQSPSVSNGNGDLRSGRAATPVPVAAPIKLKIRSIPPATADQIATSARYKAKGNDHYKLGKYGEASDTYGNAIDALPSGHVLLVPIYNNRASAYLKQGEHTGAIKDTTSVIELIGLDYDPSRESPLPAEYAEVKLADGLFKALSKRASGYEMAEKWKLAKEDWERLMGHAIASIVFDGTQGMNQRNMVSEGLARCRKMVDAQNGPPGSPKVAKKPPPPTKPKPASLSRPSKPPPSSMMTAENSAGVAKIRQEAAAAENEEIARLAFKQGVDKKIQLWSGGKENNLRGLLGSLDSVLWEGLGVKKPSMAELITEKQVKIGYMRVIGKLHPDKLNTTNTTVEQRMLANAVFGILNDAWNAFNGGK